MARLKQTLWASPLACVALCVCVSVATVAIDRANPGLIPTTFTGTPSGAQTVLTTIASSMITLITLVLTVVTVAIQLAMGQFSPRIVQALLRDRANQLSFGLFGGTAVFTTIAAVEVNDQNNFVPGVTVLVAYGLTLSSLIVLVLYVNRAVRLAFDEVRIAGASSLQVARRLRAALEDLMAIAPADRHNILNRELALLEAGVRRAYADDEDIVAALVPDTQGIGSGPDVSSKPGSATFTELRRSDDAARESYQETLTNWAVATTADS